VPIERTRNRRSPSGQDLCHQVLRIGQPIGGELRCRARSSRGASCPRMSTECCRCPLQKQRQCTADGRGPRLTINSCFNKLRHLVDRIRWYHIVAAGLADTNDCLSDHHAHHLRADLDQFLFQALSVAVTNCFPLFEMRLSGGRKRAPVMRTCAVMR
jgi:hypothetical protein